MLDTDGFLPSGRVLLVSRKLSLNALKRWQSQGERDTVLARSTRTRGASAASVGASAVAAAAAAAAIGA